MLAFDWYLTLEILKKREQNNSLIVCCLTIRVFITQKNNAKILTFKCFFFVQKPNKNEKVILDINRTNSL